MTNRLPFESFDWAPPDVELEELSARLHEIYQLEARAELPEATKERDRMLARWILKFWTLRYPDGGLPDAK